ncbi:hypothetical protein [Actinomadura macrotermitis]|uniref:DUF4288 domain-containing protein n=1 Tax=Actinomadura macrotermitis TaxID=2585200 RepID=A0A7K0BY27_9ACTN|nr:hypothetical protein [Actinomadura macrotermitis]MQY06083.1 hypothetical protein [Actinomadura macrotermitis]
MNRPGWYGVRCILRWPDHETNFYEESITVWHAASSDEAFAKAEAAAYEYADICDGEYLEFAQAYFIGDEEAIVEGTEVYSLIRESELEPDAYLTSFFNTGTERQNGE